MLRTACLLALAAVAACRAQPRAPRGHVPTDSTPPPAVPAQTRQVDSLIAEDFTLVGVPLDADSAWVLRTFGRPDSISVQGHPFVEGLRFPLWHYPDLEVLFTDADAVVSMNVRMARYRTRRGIGVGSAAAEVLAAYGVPGEGGQPYGQWRYLDPRQELHFLAFQMEEGRVVEVSFGTILD
jgi:hypothetical protein